jgi:HK97 family phage portal protein
MVVINICKLLLYYVQSVDPLCLYKNIAKLLWQSRRLLHSMSIFSNLFKSKVEEQKNVLPSRLWNAVIWGYGNTSTQKFNKRQLITQAYERNPAFYAAVNLIAQTVAEIPIYVEYQQGGKTKTTSKHPLISMLSRNSTREELVERLIKYFIVTGDCYTQIVKSNDTRPLGLIVVPSQYMENIEGDFRKPIIGYRYTEKEEILFKEDEIIHFYNPSLERYFDSFSPANVLAEYIDLNNASVTWNKNVATGGGIPPLIAKGEGLSAEQAELLRDSWQQQSGANNSHRLKIMSENLTLEKMSITPHDAEWSNAIMQSMRVIFMTLNVSSSLMNDAGNKTYNNVHDSRKALYQECAIPLARKLYSAMNRKLSNMYKDSPMIIADTDNIDVIQEDKKLQATRLVSLVKEGLMTQNEARIELRLPVSQDDSADLLIRSSIANNVPVMDRPQDNEIQPTPADPTL